MTAVLTGPGGAVMLLDENGVPISGANPLDVTGGGGGGGGTVDQGVAGLDPWLVDTGLAQGLTDAELRLSPVPISGTVAVSGVAGTVNVAVTGTAAVTQSGAWEVSLSAASLVALETINAVQSGSWTVALDGPSLAALETVTVLQGTSPWVVSGTVTATGGLTDAELRASPVEVDGSAVTQPVSAASLPLPAGASTLAEQQTQTASLSALDDWDETDRAKVNPIAGQAGVQGGAGAVTALTQRVALATDANTVKDDYDDFAAQHMTLVAATDTPITLPGSTRMVRVTNWDTANRVLVKTSAISGAADSAAARVGKAPAADLPNGEVFPATVPALHLYSASASEVTVEAFT